MLPLVSSTSTTERGTFSLPPLASSKIETSWGTPSSRRVDVLGTQAVDDVPGFVVHEGRHRDHVDADFEGEGRG